MIRRRSLIPKGVSILNLVFVEETLFGLVVLFLQFKCRREEKR